MFPPHSQIFALGNTLLMFYYINGLHLLKIKSRQYEKRIFRRKTHRGIHNGILTTITRMPNRILRHIEFADTVADRLAIVENLVFVVEHLARAFNEAKESFAFFITKQANNQWCSFKPGSAHDTRCTADIRPPRRAIFMWTT